MILTEVRDHLRKHRRATLRDMSLQFRTDPDALRGMLEKFIAKGQVEKLPSGTACGGCFHCDPSTIEVYEWVAEVADERAAFVTATSGSES